MQQPPEQAQHSQQLQQGTLVPPQAQAPQQAPLRPAPQQQQPVLQQRLQHQPPPKQQIYRPEQAGSQAPRSVAKPAGATQATPVKRAPKKRKAPDDPVAKARFSCCGARCPSHRLVLWKARGSILTSMQCMGDRRAALEEPRCQRPDPG